MTDAPQDLTPQPSAVDQLVQQIRTHIVDNRLGVGDTLPSERELGERFDAARNTVREAVRILKAYGVVEVRPKIGAVIVNRHLDAALTLFSFQTAISRDTFRDIQSFRRLIEVGAADLLLERVGEDDLIHLRALNAEMARATTAEVAAERDFAFHAALLALTGNDTLQRVFTTMQPILASLMETGKRSGGLEEAIASHDRIIDALERHDRLAFQFHMSAHLDQGLAYITDPSDA